MITQAVYPSIQLELGYTAFLYVLEVANLGLAMAV